MTSGPTKPEVKNPGFSFLMLEVAGQKEPTLLRIPVLIRNLSMGGVTLAVNNPRDLTDWDRYRGQDCILRLEAPGDQEVMNIKAKIAWTKSSDNGQLPLSLGLQMVKPPGEVLTRLNDFLTHTSQDIKGLWDRYDQVRKNPGPSHLVQHCYIAGLVLLVGGLVLQFAAPPHLQDVRLGPLVAWQSGDCREGCLAFFAKVGIR
jgi:hypothetical protein